ncbi:hypothetical protein Mgra_00007321 [Meloidogyne graminicola]|uniref:Peptidase M41 domain-containing protein n=1 Tax=Meloidogyne graminicola TaxID=189291 RepID=A0A8S9ZJ95_9BILA|nr:hypothetical protein Mgra_00007321 [Meloidogyne graminicola]
MLLKHKRNMDASFGMLRGRRQLRLLICLVVTAMALINQTVTGNEVEVGFGRHKKLEDNTVTLADGSWKIAANNGDLEEYKKAKPYNPCLDIEFEGSDIIVRYTKQGEARSQGCMVDLLTQSGSKTAVKFTIGIKNAFSLDLCLGEAVDSTENCNFLGGNCEKWKERVYHSAGNSLPFIYSRSASDWRMIRKGNRAAGEGCKGPCSGGKLQCMEWTGLAAAFAYDVGGKFVVNTMVAIGEPGGMFCDMNDIPSSNTEAKFDLTVDSGKQSWFEIAGCDSDYNKQSFCIDKNKMGERLNDVIAWEIKDAATKIPGSGGFNHLFTFALLPQQAHHPHSNNDRRLGKKGIIEKVPLTGPRCDEIYVRFPGDKFKLLVPSGGDIGPIVGPTVEEFSTLPPPQTLPPLVFEDEGNGMIFVIIGVVVLLLLVVVGVLVWLFVLRKSDPDAITANCYFKSKRRSKNVKLSDWELYVLAYHECSHGVVGEKTGRRVKEISIIPNANNLGLTEFVDENDNFETKDDIENSIITLFAGGAGEIFFFNNLTTGSMSDFKKGNKLCVTMIARYGMGQKGPFTIEGFSSDFYHKIQDKEVEQSIYNYWKRTKYLVEENNTAIDFIARKLILVKKMSGEEFRQLLKKFD